MAKHTKLGIFLLAVVLQLSLATLGAADVGRHHGHGQRQKRQRAA